MKIEKLIVPSIGDGILDYGILRRKINELIDPINYLISIDKLRLNTEQPSQEPPIDCNCNNGGSILINNPSDYCAKCGGQLPTHPKHKSNSKPSLECPEIYLKEPKECNINMPNVRAGKTPKSQDKYKCPKCGIIMPDDWCGACAITPSKWKSQDIKRGF